MGTDNGKNGPSSDPSSDMDKPDSPDEGNSKIVSLADIRAQISKKVSDSAVSDTQVEIKRINDETIRLLKEFGLRDDQIIHESGEYGIRLTLNEFLELMKQQKKPSISVKLEDIPRWTEQNSD